MPYQERLKVPHRSVTDSTISMKHSSSSFAANGTIVRVAYPYLAIADVGHLSAVDPERSQDVLDRSLRHEWNLSLYYDPVSSTTLTLKSRSHDWRKI
jgi:hypothetical protein